MTLLGTFLAALKTIMTSVLQSAPVSFLGSKYRKLDDRYVLNQLPQARLQLHPLDLLSRLSPMAFTLCVVFAHFSGELDRVRLHSAREVSLQELFILFTNGILAFALNIISFSANRRVGPLSMTVAGTPNFAETLEFRCADQARSSKYQASSDHPRCRIPVQPVSITSQCSGNYACPSRRRFLCSRGLSRATIAKDSIRTRMNGRPSFLQNDANSLHSANILRCCFQGSKTMSWH